MSKPSGRTRDTAAKKPARTTRRGEVQLEKYSQDLVNKADHLTDDSSHHSSILSSQDTASIHSSIQHLQEQATRMTALNRAHTKSLDMIKEQSDQIVSDKEEEEHSPLGSYDTERYTLLSSPLSIHSSDKSPRQREQELPTQTLQPSHRILPQFPMNPPQTSPNVTASPLDAIAIMQNMFAQQADANRQQQEAMIAHQASITAQQAETNKQLQLLLAKQLDRQLDQQEKQLKRQETTEERQAIADARLAIKPMKDTANIVQYLQHFESELQEAEIPSSKWKKILIGKLSPKADKICAHLVNDQLATYDDLKRYLLANLGPSMDELCNVVHGAYYSDFHDKTEAQKLQHSKYIAERYFLNCKNKEEHLAMRLYKFHANKKFAHQVKLNKSQSFADLLETATSFDGQLQYEKTNKLHTSSYSSSGYYSHKDKNTHRKPFCEYCRKVGHLEEQCFKKQGITKPSTPNPQQGNKPNFQEQQSKPKNTKYYNKDTGVKTRPTTVNWSRTNDNINSIKGIVNGHDTDIVLDTGAQITVVPGKLVYEDNLTGNSIDIIGINGDPRPYQTAKISITLNGTEVEEIVAVAPEHQLNSKVLLATPICQKATKQLIDGYISKNKKQQADSDKHTVTPQVQVATRQTTPISYTEQLENSDNEDDRASDESYSPDSDYTETEDTSDDDIPKEPTAPSDTYLPSSLLPSSPLQPQNQTKPLESDSNISTSYPRPYSLSVTPEPYSSVKPLESNDSSSNQDNNCPQTPLKPNELEPYSSTLPPYETLPELPITFKGTTTSQLKDQVKQDQTLKTIRGLAHHGKNGYEWDNGLIFHVTSDQTLGIRKRLVLPKPHRLPLIRLAHNHLGHFSINKTKSIISDKFTWPGISVDVKNFILSCDKCKTFNKHSHKQPPFHMRPVITEPFDEVALDIIGPLPRSRHGFRYALTAICMASRWPEVYPLRNIKADTIASSLIEFIARNGIPSKLLTDQGSQFTSEVMNQTCRLLGVTHITTVPYRPQGNGILERFHGTLKPLLAKVTSKTIDWVQFLPLALSAIRAVPCRSTGYSPSELVFGKNNRNVLDILFEGWTNKSFANVDIHTWVDELNNKLEILRDSATLNNTVARQHQNAHSTYSRSKRSYKPGDLVYTRIPGCRANLQASWEGPFQVVKSIPPLNYEIQDPQNTWSRVTHLNNLKTYKPLLETQPVQVHAASLVAEENVELSKVVDKGPSLVGGPCVGYSQGEMDQLLEDYIDVFSSKPGEAQVEQFSIKLEKDALPSSRPPYQVPIHLREEVGLEIDKLLDLNIIEPSNSVDWCAPIVPVRKPDKSIRLCVDYRELNKVTPLDRHVIPTLPSILDKVGHAKVLSKIDLTSGFHQIQVEPGSRDYTTFLSPKGKFRFVRMPFGLKNAPSQFQRCIEKVLQPVTDCAAVYIDDIVVFSDDWPSHLEHLNRVFDCFKHAKLTAKPSKCSFGKTKLQYLGHIIGSGQVAVPEHRVTALAQYEKPKSKKTLRSFLGCVSYYRKFINNYSDMSALLTPATSVSAPKVVVWTDAMDKAFEMLKVSLSNNVILTIPSISDTYTLHTDASGFGIGACLHVIREGQELPVAFYSRQLQGAEKNYSITELETLAIVASLKHFEYYVYGTTLSIFTDHKACTALLTSSVLNNRLKRMTLYLQDKDITINYRPGAESSNADGFSRQFDARDMPSAMDSSTPGSLPTVEAAGGCWSSGATVGTPPNTPPKE